MKLKLLFIVCLCLVAFGSAIAYGPYYVYPLNKGGQPYRWSNNKITWYYDAGDLSSKIPLEPKTGKDCKYVENYCTSIMYDCGVLKCIEQQMSAWQNTGMETVNAEGKNEFIKTVNFTAVNGGSVGEDITKDNYSKYLKKASDEHVGIIVFDADGSILEKNYGKKNKFFLGQTMPDPDTSYPYFKGGVIIYNGLVVDGVDEAGNPELDGGAQMYGATILHELGHLLGLDHSQPLTAALGGKYDAPPTIPEGVPTMYPTLITAEQKDLHVDDKLGMSFLYGNKDFKDKFCVIKGEIKNASDGAPYQGVNVIAYADIEELDQQYKDERSFVSGVLYPAETANGEYILAGIVPNTTYKVVKEAVLEDFQSGAFANALSPYDSENHPNFKGPNEKDLAKDGKVISAGGGKYDSVACSLSEDGTENEAGSAEGSLSGAPGEGTYVAKGNIIEVDSSDTPPHDAKNETQNATGDEAKKKGWCMSISGTFSPAYGMLIPLATLIIIRRRK